VFLRGATSLLDPGAAMTYPKYSDKLDFEAELAVIVGKSAADVGTRALDYVAGYSCFECLGETRKAFMRGGHDIELH
jgi:2-keto-4-pentenoate hydratase/2-oxohepta-3-ene-1,7-dioic acid hydratase in catechol pathway